MLRTRWKIYTCLFFLNFTGVISYAIIEFVRLGDDPNSRSIPIKQFTARLNKTSGCARPLSGPVYGDFPGTQWKEDCGSGGNFGVFPMPTTPELEKSDESTSEDLRKTELATLGSKNLDASEASTSEDKPKTSEKSKTVSWWITESSLKDCCFAYGLFDVNRPGGHECCMVGPNYGKEREEKQALEFYCVPNYKEGTHPISSTVYIIEKEQAWSFCRLAACLKSPMDYFPQNEPEIKTVPSCFEVAKNSEEVGLNGRYKTPLLDLSFEESNLRAEQWRTYQQTFSSSKVPASIAHLRTNRSFMMQAMQMCFVVQGERYHYYSDFSSPVTLILAAVPNLIEYRFESLADYIRVWIRILSSQMEALQKCEAEAFITGAIGCDEEYGNDPAVVAFAYAVVLYYFQPTSLKKFISTGNERFNGLLGVFYEKLQQEEYPLSFFWEEDELMKELFNGVVKAFDEAVAAKQTGLIPPKGLL